MLCMVSSSVIFANTHVLTVCLVFVLHVQLTKTKVAERNVASVIEQDVLGFQVSVDDIEPVETLQRTEELGCIEPGSVDVESLLLLQVVEQFASIDKGEDEIKFFRRLEGELQRNNERVVDLGEHRSLRKSVRDLGPGDDVCLSDRLEGVNPACVLFSG